MHLENRLIAMLDVLGLSNQIEDKSKIPLVIEKYNRLIKEAREKIFTSETMEGSTEVNTYNFEIGEFVFDTLVLISYPIDVKSSCKFILSTMRLMELFSKENMPLRGAIGIGDYFVDDETKIFLSDIFKRLSKEEQNQQWAGCVLLSEAEEKIISNVMGVPPIVPKRCDVLHQLKVPLKSNSKEKRWCLNWTYKLLGSEIISLLEYMQGDSTKQKNTEAYISTLNSMDDDYQILPPEYYPATKMKTIKTRSSMNIQFEDENGLPVEPGCDQWSIQVFDKQ